LSNVYAISFHTNAIIRVLLQEGGEQLARSLAVYASRIRCSGEWCTYTFTEDDLARLKRKRCVVVVTKSTLREYSIPCTEFVEYVKLLNSDEV